MKVCTPSEVNGLQYYEDIVATEPAMDAAYRCQKYRELIDARATFCEPIAALRY